MLGWCCIGCGQSKVPEIQKSLDVVRRLEAHLSSGAEVRPLAPSLRCHTYTLPRAEVRAVFGKSESGPSQSARANPPSLPTFLPSSLPSFLPSPSSHPLSSTTTPLQNPPLWLQKEVRADLNFGRHIRHSLHSLRGVSMPVAGGECDAGLPHGRGESPPPPSPFCPRPWPFQRPAFVPDCPLPNPPSPGLSP